MRKILTFLILSVLLSCQGPEPRKPVKVKSGSFMKESVERNKKLLSLEEEQIRRVIKQDSLREYFPTAAGSWYAYEMKNEVAEYTPKTDDLVRFSYALLTLDNDTIYSREEIGLQIYKVDKQELFPGLRNSIKLMKEGETAIFLFPSSLGYGYLGDKNKIGVNVPLKVVVTIIGIEPDTENKIP